MDQRPTKVKKLLLICSLVLITVVYFALRLPWREYVIFGFDMPWTALAAQSFIKNGSYLTAQKFVLDNSWGFPSWSAALLFFYTPFLLVSSHPITLSVLFSVVNLISIAAIVVIGWKFASPIVGVVAGLLFATQPWWVLFSQFFYSPSTIMIFICLAMLAFFQVWREKNRIWIPILILLWSILVSFYVATFPFILTSFIFLFGKCKYLLKSKKYILLGIVLSAFVFLPTIKYFWGNLQEINKFRQAYKVESIIARAQIVVPSHFEILSGSKFQWQLGYSYGDFVKTFPVSERMKMVLAFGLLAAFVYETCLAIKLSQLRFFRLLILAWFLSPFWFLLIAPLRIACFAPRYFLISIPAAVLLFALSFRDLFQNLFPNHPNLRNLWVIFPLLISLYWSGFIIKYQTFIKNYSYPQGKLGEADTPYIFIEKAVKWAVADSQTKGYRNLVLSNYRESPTTFSLWQETKYIWEYVLGRNYQIDPTGSVGYYQILHSTTLDQVNFPDFTKFGPFVVFENKGLRGS